MPQLINNDLPCVTVSNCNNEDNPVRLVSFPSDDMKSIK
ncbi:hypothetical protein AHYW_003660 [Providencia manganoxydans]